MLRSSPSYRSRGAVAGNREHGRPAEQVFNTGYKRGDHTANNLGDLFVHLGAARLSRAGLYHLRV
jgi:hypothetical protein